MRGKDAKRWLGVTPHTLPVISLAIWLMMGEFDLTVFEFQED
jgi:hypothetical protein